MKKSQLPLGMIFGIILFLIALFATIFWAKGLFRLTAQGADDFGKLDTTIREVASSNLYTLENLPYRLDDKTAIVFFNKDSQSVKITAIKEVTTAGRVETPIEIKKIGTCVKNCMCLCKELKIDASRISYECENWICAPEYDFDIVVSTSQKCSDKLITNCLVSTTGGYVYERNALFTQNWPRDRALSIQKIGDNKIAICDVLDEKKNCILP